MDKAVERILRAIDSHEVIALYGDYDADGLSAIALLARALRQWGVTPLLFTPHRIRDGYGLNCPALDRLADQGVNLLITVDCGTANAAEVAHARRRGMDVIVTDHHHLAAVLPDCTAVINPQRAENQTDLTELAGVGVAYYLVRALGKARFGAPENLDELQALVAVGTVADVVPLVRDNRLLVTVGLDQIRDGAHTGLAALLAVCKRPAVDVDAQTIAFSLAPALNAPGRLADPVIARDLLDPVNSALARAAAIECDRYNGLRRTTTAAYLATAEALLAARYGGTLPRVLMIGDPSWNAGIAGIVAGKLAERHHRPTFAFAAGALCKGSARSIAGVDLMAMIAPARAHFTTVGGHTGAAGFSFASADGPVIEQALNAWAATLDAALFIKEITIDLALTGSDLHLGTLALVNLLAPFEGASGTHNPQPRFLITNCQVSEAKQVGGDKSHLSFRATPPGGAAVKAIGFFLGGRLDELDGGPIDLVCELAVDRFRGREALSLQIRDFKPSGEGHTGRERP
jgi:single-stranded-DNA-specific exonuclease